VKLLPTAAAAFLSRSSWASKIRRKSIQVSSGTYCKALAQLDRRMMSQIDLTKDDKDFVEPIDFGCLACFALFVFFWGDMLIS